MSRLVEAGKVRWLGMSEVAAKTLSDACAIHPISAIQSEYSLWHRDVEKDVQPTCRELGVTFVPFSPLGRSFLTGALTTSDFGPNDLRATLPRFQPGAMAQNLRLVSQLASFADERNVTSAQIALAWLIAKSTPTSAVAPIPGSKRPTKILENRGAADVKLNADEMEELEIIFAPEAIVGARYSDIEASRAGL
jgi:aryl-alcohol dehydrogenase-like predicted oxidoreductase